ncbi:MAG: GAF domain-containing SpoIIE family protein phosphatase [Planctomycetota bacterium]
MFFRRKKAKDSRLDPPTGSVDGPWPDLEEPAALSGEDGDTQFLTGDQSADRRTVKVLLDAIAQVANARVFDPADLDALLRRIVDNSIEVTGAERGLLILEGDDGQLLVRVARSEDGKDIEGEVRFSTTTARKVLDEVAPVRSTVGSDSEALELARSVFDLKLRAVMCVPLSAGRRSDGSSQGKPMGALYVDSKAASRTFGQRDLSLFAALAQQISMTMESARLHLDSLEKVRLEQSLELASAIQRGFIPSAPGKIAGFEVHGWYRPAEGTAGDFYDFVQAKNGRLGVVVGDVTGHGIGPALITASAQAGLRSYLRLLGDAGEALTLLNQDLIERIEDGRFLTLFLAVLSPDGKVETINAGHPLALHWRAATGECVPVPGGGPALGMIPDETYTSAGTIEMAPGDALLAYSDGVSELKVEGDEMLGDDGMARLFAECMSEGGDLESKIVQLAERALGAAKGAVDDDITLLVVRRTG